MWGNILRYSHLQSHLNLQKQRKSHSKKRYDVLEIQVVLKSVFRAFVPDERRETELKKKRSKPESFSKALWFQGLGSYRLWAWHLLASACASFLLPDPHSFWVQEALMAVLPSLSWPGKFIFIYLGFPIRKILSFPLKEYGVWFLPPLRRIFILWLLILCGSALKTGIIFLILLDPICPAVGSVRHFVVSLFSQAWIISTLVEGSIQ